MSVFRLQKSILRQFRIRPLSAMHRSRAVASGASSYCEVHVAIAKLYNTGKQSINRNARSVKKVCNLLFCFSSMNKG